MTESNHHVNDFIAPMDAVTIHNIDLAVKNLGGMEQSMDALIEASERPENQSFAPILLEKAVEIFNVAESLQATSPIQF